MKLRHLHCSSCATEVVQLIAVAMGGIWEVFPQLAMGAAHLCKGLRRVFQRVYLLIDIC